MVSGVAIHEGGHCIVAFNLGFKIEKVSIFGETGNANIIFEQINETSAMKIARIEIGIHKALLHADLMNEEYSRSNKYFEEARANAAEEIAVLRNYDELARKNEEPILDILLAGYAAELVCWKPPKSYFKKKYPFELDMANFVNTRLCKRDLYSKLADMKGRAEGDLRKFDEIINLRKKRISSIESLEKQSISSSSNYYDNALFEPTYAFLKPVETKRLEEDKSYSVEKVLGVHFASELLAPSGASISN